MSILLKSSTENTNLKKFWEGENLKGNWKDSLNNCINQVNTYYHI